MRSFISFFLKSLPFIALILVIIQVVVTNQLVGLGEYVTDIESRIEATVAENEILRQKVASASSLLLIEQKAKEQGMTEPNATSYMPLDTLPLALGSQ